MLGLRPFERNFACQAAHARGPVMLSSFDADVCLVLRRQQDAWPVFFLSEAGTAAQAPDDPRAAALADAAHFAGAAGLRGVVAHAHAILRAPRLAAAAKAAAGGAVLVTYGQPNNDAHAVRAQQRAGVDAVIVDNVRTVLREGTRAEAHGGSG